MTVFSALGWVLLRRRHHLIISALPNCWRWFLALALRGCQPGVSSNQRTGQPQSCDGIPDFIAYYKEPAKSIPRT